MVGTNVTPAAFHRSAIFQNQDEERSKKVHGRICSLQQNYVAGRGMSELIPRIIMMVGAICYIICVFKLGVYSVKESPQSHMRIESKETKK